MDINEVFQQIDLYFEKNEAKEAERYMLNVLGMALKNEDQSHLILPLLNELIGYYRQTSEEEKLLKIIEEAVTFAKKVDSISYATTLLNAATGYRSIGRLQEASDFYEKVREIYEKELPDEDMRKAGLYNNMSLLSEEMKDYNTAKKLQQKALVIAVKNQSAFEIAVSYANLANSTLALEEYEESLKNSNQAIKVFREHNILDNHYAAALYAMGMVLMAQQQNERALECFNEGMEIIEKMLGHNSQYERMREAAENCKKDLENNFVNNSEKNFEKGMDICRKYYETYGIPMIHQNFLEYEDKIAVGLVGEGSDCFGFDDGYSMDHDWGPDFCLWLDDETYAEIGEKLQRKYDELPKEFMGYKRTTTATGKMRRGVLSISEFFVQHLGKKNYELLCSGQLMDYAEIEDYELAVCVNGEVFKDKLGKFTKFREQLNKGFPENVRMLKIAESAARFSQNGQYNFNRMVQRKDFFTANRMASNAIYEALKLLHYIENVYPPHEKWLRVSALKCDNGPELMVVIRELQKKVHLYFAGPETRDIGISQVTAEDINDDFEEIGQFFADLLYKKNDISDVESYLVYHVDELVQKAQYVLKTKDELVNIIAKTEFVAFDKVQNEGGRASCQNDWPTFLVMRKSQYLTWNKDMLVQYLYDFNREFALGHNLITEKYGRMMESTAPEKYEEIKDKFPVINEQKKAVIEQIVAIQMTMMETFAKEYPNVTENARSLHTYEDNFMNTSYETYLRGEISTYSDKMLQLYGAFVVEHARSGNSIARETIENTAKLYGFKTLEDFERSAKDNDE